VTTLYSVSLSPCISPRIFPTISRDVDDDELSLEVSGKTALIEHNNFEIARHTRTLAHTRTLSGRKMGKYWGRGCAMELYTFALRAGDISAENEQVKNLSNPVFWLQSIGRNSHLLAYTVSKCGHLPVLTLI